MIKFKGNGYYLEVEEEEVGCYVVGPFTTKEGAEQAQKALSNNGLITKVHQFNMAVICDNNGNPLWSFPQPTKGDA